MDDILDNELGDIWIHFRSFNSIEECQPTKDFLTEHNIPFKIEDTSLQFDVSFSNSDLLKNLVIKVQSKDLEAINRLLSPDVNAIHQLDKDDYLLSFTDEELIDVLKKKDEWSHDDFIIAKTILKERGHSITDEQIQTWYTDRIEELSIPEKGNPNWIFAGYALSVASMFIGLGIGWNYQFLKKKLPDGTKVYHYNETTRFHGKMMIFIAVAIVLVFAFISIQNNLL